MKRLFNIQLLGWIFMGFGVSTVAPLMAIGRANLANLQIAGFGALAIIMVIQEMSGLLQPIFARCNARLMGHLYIPIQLVYIMIYMLAGLKIIGITTVMVILPLIQILSMGIGGSYRSHVKNIMVTNGLCLRKLEADSSMLVRIGTISGLIVSGLIPPGREPVMMVVLAVCTTIFLVTHIWIMRMIREIEGE